MDNTFTKLIDAGKEKAYKAIDTLSIEMRNRRYEIRMNRSGKKIFLSVNNRSKLLHNLYTCMIHQQDSINISSVNVYSGEIEIVSLTPNQITSILTILDKKNDDIDIMMSKYYRRIRETDSLSKLNLLLIEIVDMYIDESKRYYGSMK